ncbi:unannotated protein [freshwater metagenome]|uniref:Unannotated protein n=1 Tax=freshwater metagenome TaxID=449393 RepID=A0A6J7KKI1_9ZZZZ
MLALALALALVLVLALALELVRPQDLYRKQRMLFQFYMQLFDNFYLRKPSLFYHLVDLYLIMEFQIHILLIQHPM